MFVCCVCCQVEVSATSWSLVQRNPTEYGASLSVIKKPSWTRRLSPRWVAVPGKAKFFFVVTISILCRPFSSLSASFYSRSVKQRNAVVLYYVCMVRNSAMVGVALLILLAYFSLLER
jgi:hypothetical protein